MSLAGIQKIHPPCVTWWKHTPFRPCLIALWLVLASLAGAAGVNAADRNDVWTLYREGETSFRQANELLKTDPDKARGLFEKAALCFEAVNREGGIENGRLFYNIGNTYFRLGDMGKTIFNYRKAELYTPQDVNLQQNLNYARSRCIDQITPKPRDQVLRTLFFWHYDLGGVTRSWLFAGCFALLWVFAGVYLFKKSNWLRYAALCCAGLSLLLAGSLAVEAYEQSHGRSGVILEKEVVGRKGDSTTFEPTFKEPLHTGVEFEVLEERKGWLHIELADGRRCWIPQSSAGIVSER
jgi:tetratricopeptide (TPR) repeat protein